MKFPADAPKAKVLSLTCPAVAKWTKADHRSLPPIPLLPSYFFLSAVTPGASTPRMRWVMVPPEPMEYCHCFLIEFSGRHKFRNELPCISLTVLHED